MAESNPSAQERKPGRKIWIRILACVLAVVMLLSLFLLDAARIKLGRDAKNETEKAGAEALAENSEYLNASAAERMTQWLRSAIRSPKTYEDYYQIAAILIAQGEYARALPNIDAAVRLYTGGEPSVLDELYLKQGSLHAMLGEYDAMEESFTHISEQSDYQPQRLMLIAQAAIEQNDTPKAIRNLNEYLTYRPEDTDMALALGQLYVMETDYTNAAAVYGGVIDRGEDRDGSLYFLRGSCRMELKEYASALADFESALARGYADASLCNAQCALCSFFDGQYADCVRYGRAALEAPSEAVSTPDLYYFMGVSALALGEYEAALAIFTQVRALDAARQDADYYAAVCLMALGRPDEAIERFTALIEAGYSLSLCCYNRAACYIAKGQPALAEPDLVQVVALDEDAELVATAQALLSKMH